MDFYFLYRRKTFREATSEKKKKNLTGRDIFQNGRIIITFEDIN